MHASDDPGRDLLEGGEDAAFVGGFAAAAKMLGRSADLIMLDVTDPQRPRARALSTALARIVRARAINPRFIAGQMRHGPRGAAELAETVDRLVAFAETTDAVASELFDLLHDAYVADADVREFLLRENPQAATAIAERLDAARRRGFWHPRRNDVDASLSLLRGGGHGMTAAALTLPQRRGACPGLSAPMTTGDGLLVRLLPIGTIALDAFAALCAAARQHGNGIIEVTSRGSIQIRGLSAASAPRFAAAVAALGIAAGDGIPVLINPLAGLDAEDIIDAGALAADLRLALARAFAGAKSFPPKSQSRSTAAASLDLDGIAADVRLRAQAVNGVAALCVSVGGDGRERDPSRLRCRPRRCRSRHPFA